MSLEECKMSEEDTQASASASMLAFGDRRRVKKKQCLGSHACPNGGDGNGTGAAHGHPCFHKCLQEKWQEEKSTPHPGGAKIKDPIQGHSRHGHAEDSLYPNAYYPPELLGVDKNANLLTSQSQSQSQTQSPQQKTLLTRGLPPPQQLPGPELRSLISSKKSQAELNSNTNVNDDIDNEQDDYGFLSRQTRTRSTPTFTRTVGHAFNVNAPSGCIHKISASHSHNFKTSVTNNTTTFNSDPKLKVKVETESSDPNRVEPPVKKLTASEALALRTDSESASPKSPGTSTNPKVKLQGKNSSRLLRRRKGTATTTCFPEKKDGRSRSLTHIDNLDPAMLVRSEDMDSRSEPDTSHDQCQFLDVRHDDGGGGSNANNASSREHRRKKLARSQVSSSEFFSICFQMPTMAGQGRGGAGDDEHQNRRDRDPSGIEEFLPVTRGISLGDALRPIFEKRNLSISNVNIFVDSSKTPLPSPANTDTYFVAGKNLTIKAKESPAPDPKFHSRSFKSPSRKSSAKQKHKFFSVSAEDPNNYSDVSTLGSSPISLEPAAQHGSPSHNRHPHLSASGSISHEGSLKVKSTGKQTTKWGGLFSNSFKDKSKMELLAEQLNSYSQNGTPKPSFLPSADEIESQYTLEKDWKCIVHGWKEMSERNIQQQTAIWELVETEVVYLRTIRVITDLFLACIYNLQAANILNEIDRDQLFSNIPEIYKSNQVLWLECILPMVQKSRDTHQPLEPIELGNGFRRFGSICQPYTKYCLDQTKCQRYCREKYQENEYFKTYLAWCETRKECNRLRLMDILVRPMQRMTKYSLLLKAILKHTEELEQRKCIEEMIFSVEKFVRSVNGALRSRQDAERLQGIAERIETYDVVETREDELESLVKSHSKLDLFHPMPGCCTSKRWLIFDVDVKIKDSSTSKMDAHCFLFTDMLLICKPLGRSKGEKMKVIRQPYVVDRLIIRELSKDPCSLGLVYLNEYGTASAALSLHFNEPKLVKVTMDHIKKAQKMYNELKEKEQMEYQGDEENGVIMYLNHHLGGSSRGSQLSSLIHSHSGSVEMEASVLSSQAISFEHELRGSSLSSDEGNINETAGISLVKSRSMSSETGAGRPTSPRRERRLFLSKSPSPSPNTLTVQIPIPNLSGQSLPNLATASEASPPTYGHNLSLTVPKCLLSPTHRGVSYPPPSPKSLTRSYALLQSRNPPLQKSKNILGPASAAPEKTVSLDVQVPEIRGLTYEPQDPPRTADARLQDGFQSTSPTKCFSPHELERPKEFFPSTFDEHSVSCQTKTEAAAVPADYHFTRYDVSFPATASESANFGNTKRLPRNERVESKRYHTAGAIDDMRKETSKDRDSAIYKRLSWNCGPQKLQEHQASIQGQYDASMLGISQSACESMASIRSSSGVSSTSSLLHCISDLESNSTSTASTTITTPCAITPTQLPYHPLLAEHVPAGVPCTSPIAKQLPNVRIAVCEPGESERLLYNSERVLETDLKEISNHIEAHFVEGGQCKSCSSSNPQTPDHTHTNEFATTRPRPTMSQSSSYSGAIMGQASKSSPEKNNSLMDIGISDNSIQSSEV